MITEPVLQVADVRAAVVVFGEALAQHKARIDSLNVYPVPDGDTGTNMALTLASVAEALAEAGEEPDAVWQAIRHGSLMGARGNSGVIVCQILRGLADALAAEPVLDAPALARAFRAAADAAYKAVVRPVEGTILTVVREIAEEAESAVADAAAAGRPLGLVELLDRTAVRGADALARTPQLLAVLADAGVVDAGGAGLLLLVDALLTVVDGRPLPEVESLGGIAVAAPSHAEGVGDLRYEVMYLLAAPDEAIPAFKSAWSDIGDSIVVVGGDGLFNCHIHTNDIGAAVEAALDLGRPSRIRITDLFDELTHVETLTSADDGADDALLVDAEPAVTAVVAIGAGAGVRRIFRSLGARAVLTGGQSMNPSTAQLLEAVEAVAAGSVVILPNNKNIIAVANQVDAQTAKTVRVVPTRGITEGFAALLAYDPESTADANMAAMSRAAESVVAGEVTRAVRDATTSAGPVREGEWLGLSREGIVAVAPDLVGAATALLDRLVTPEHELVTIIAGADAPPGAAAAVSAWLAEHRPEVETETHDGLQPVYPFLFGVE